GATAPGDHQLRPGQPGHLKPGVRSPDTAEGTPAGPDGNGRAVDPDHPRRMRPPGADRHGGRPALPLEANPQVRALQRNPRTQRRRSEAGSAPTRVTTSAIT